MLIYKQIRQLQVLDQKRTKREGMCVFEEKGVIKKNIFIQEERQETV